MWFPTMRSVALSSGMSHCRSGLKAIDLLIVQVAFNFLPEPQVMKMCQGFADGKSGLMRIKLPRKQIDMASNADRLLAASAALSSCKRLSW